MAAHLAAYCTLRRAGLQTECRTLHLHLTS